MGIYKYLPGVYYYDGGNLKNDEYRQVSLGGDING
jgi:hypothetical protein